MPRRGGSTIRVLAAGKPGSVKVRIGDPKGAPPKATVLSTSAGVQLSATSLGSDVAGPYLAGEVVNHSGVAQHNMPIFAVALRDGRVVAAGRALVPNLPASAGKPTAFRIISWALRQAPTSSSPPPPP